MPVAFEELAGSPHFTATRANFRGTRRFKVAWADIYAFTTELVGSGGVGSGGVGAASPAIFPGLANTACVNVEVGPFVEKNTNGALTDHTTQQNAYDDAEVVATYETLPPTSGLGSGGDASDPTPLTGTVIEWSRDHSGEYMQVPSRGFRWAGDNELLSADIGVGITIPATDYIATWHYVKNPPLAAIRKLKGLVNNATFHGVPAGLLLFMGARENYSRDLSGEATYTLQYVFKERTVVSLADTSVVYGWNYLFRVAVAGSGWTVSNWCDTSPPLYRSGNFFELFA